MSQRYYIGATKLESQQFAINELVDDTAVKNYFEVMISKNQVKKT
jgi:hypothetical protein